MPKKKTTKAKASAPRQVDPHGLEPRQRRFVEEYLVDFNATRAARDAGYSPASASSIAWENLRKPEIEKAINDGKEAALQALGVSRERVLGELAALAFSDLSEAFDEDGGLLPIRKMPARLRAAVASVEVEQQSVEGVSVGTVAKLKLWDKGAALERLGKNLKLFTDKVELSGGLTLEQMVLGSMEPPAGGES